MPKRHQRVQGATLLYAVSKGCWRRAIPRPAAFWRTSLWKSHRFEPVQRCCHKKTSKEFSLLATFPMERVTGLEPADTSLGSWGLTTWRHPRMCYQSYRFAPQMQGCRSAMRKITLKAQEKRRALPLGFRLRTQASNAKAAKTAACIDECLEYHPLIMIFLPQELRVPLHSPRERFRGVVKRLDKPIGGIRHRA